MPDVGRSEPSQPKLGPGDAAYALAWCAWRQADREAWPGWDEDEARQRFVRWWNDSGGVLLDDYGYQLLDTERPE